MLEVVLKSFILGFNKILLFVKIKSYKVNYGPVVIKVELL